MRRTFFSLLLAASCSLPSSEVAVDVDALKLQISTFEGGISPARLANLEGDVAGALMSLASNPQEKATYRTRAIKGLRLYPEERVFQYLKSELTRYDTVHFALLPEMVQSIEVFSEQHPSEIAALLSPLTTHESLIVKEFTIRTLAVNPSIEAKALLSDMALRETEPVIQDALRSTSR